MGCRAADGFFFLHISVVFCVVWICAPIVFQSSPTFQFFFRARVLHSNSEPFIRRHIPTYGVCASLLCCINKFVFGLSQSKIRIFFCSVSFCLFVIFCLGHLFSRHRRIGRLSVSVQWLRTMDFILYNRQRYISAYFIISLCGWYLYNTSVDNRYIELPSPICATSLIVVCQCELCVSACVGFRFRPL